MAASKYWYGNLNVPGAGETGLFWLMPLVAVCSLLTASTLPWLSDPLGQPYVAWKIMIDVIWFGHMAVANYGLLCLLSAVSIMIIVGVQLRDMVYNRCEYSLHRPGTYALLCFAPVALFLWQYICVDSPSMDLLASHKTQQLLIQQRFGYTLPPPLVSLQPFTLTATALGGRLQLLLAQISFGPLLLCISSCMIAITWRCDIGALCRKKVDRLSRFLAIPVLLVLMIPVISPSAVLLCMYEAKIVLAAGNDDEALHWLSLANDLNPELEQTTGFHIARGQALYFLAPARMDDDSRVYLASVYCSQRDYLDAYYQLLPAWRGTATPSWFVGEMSITLENLAEAAHPLTPIPGKAADSLDNDRTALLWLGLLLHVDPTNIYAHYTTARINYDLHGTLACKDHMIHVLHLGANADIASSAYTYLALSENEMGNYVNARGLLLEAVAVDPNYHNNIAREELSGLH